MNTVVCAKTNQDIILLDQIANSGEGKVWTTNWSRMLAKIYHHPTPDRFAKLKAMIIHQPDDPNKQLNHNSFAFPQSLIKDNQGNLIGFLMPQIIGGIELINIYNPKIRKSKKLEVDWHFLHYVALNIASIMAAIHREGYIIGDIKPQNILVNSQALPSFIDTDSFQVRHPYRDQIYPCLVGTDGYTPPELIGKDFHNIEQYIYHDNFRLGVLIYQLLFSYHPFSLGHWQGAGDKPEQNELIKQGIWIESDHNLLIHNQNTIPLNILHPAIQKLFKKCFNEGYSQPHLRPSAEDWFYGLSQGVNHLKVCDKIDSHVHSSLENNCYWCDRKSKLGADIFELPTGIKSTSKTRLKNTNSNNQTKKKSNSQQNINTTTSSFTSLKIFSALDTNEILKQVGENITVVGKIHSVKEVGNLKIINFNTYNKKDKLQSFKAVFYGNQLNSGLIQFNPVIDLDTLISWVGKFVIVSGKVEIYNHPTNGTFYPQIILVYSSQIEKIKAKDVNNQTNIDDQSQQKSSNQPVTPVKVSTPPQQSSSTQSTYSYSYVKLNSPPFQAQPAPTVTPLSTTTQSSPTQNQNSQNTQSNQSNSTSNSSDSFGCFALLIIILIVIILPLFVGLKLGAGWGIMAFLITFCVCVSFSSYQNGDLEGFKAGISLFVLPLSFMTGITWFYGIGWGILGLIISFFLGALFLP